MDAPIRHFQRPHSRGYQKDSPAMIHPNILIGAGETLTKQFAEKHGITHVINCANDEDSPSWFRKEYQERYRCINAIDSMDVNILLWYPEFKTSMKRFLQDSSSKVIFVHCQCGINRSAFLALMFVCDCFGFPFISTEASVIKQRPCALTNTAFRKQVWTALSKKST
jgi:hypothetical protein